MKGFIDDLTGAVFDIVKVIFTYLLYFLVGMGIVTIIIFLGLYLFGFIFG